MGRTDETCSIYSRTGNSGNLTKWKAPREKEEEGTPVRFVFKRSLHLFEPAVPISESLEQAKNKGKKRKGFLRR